MSKIMTSEADSLLKKLCAYYKSSGAPIFTSLDIEHCSQESLNELATFGYLTISNDVCGTIHLTDKALNYFKTI